MATHFSILAWRILRTEEPDELQSIGLHRVGHNWSGFAHPHAWLMNVNYTYCDHFTIYVNIESCHTSETNTLYVNYTSVFKMWYAHTKEYYSALKKDWWHGWTWGTMSFPGGSVGKDSSCSVGDCLQCRRLEFDPWVRKNPWRRRWQPVPVFLPGKSHRQRSLMGCGP